MDKYIKISTNCAMLFCMVQFFFSCQAQKMCSNCGEVIFKTRYYNSVTREYLKSESERDLIMWYKDSLTIKEAHHVYFYEDSYKKKSTEVKIDHYKFMDLTTREVYEYSSFSDTAKLLKKCAATDSNCIGECWKFFNDKVIIQTKNLKLISDTAIDGIVYKRIRSIDTVQTGKGVLQCIVYGYLRCDKKGDIYNIDAKFSKEMGCPLVRMDYFYTPELYPATIYEMEFRPGVLTKQELKVFDVWENNAKTYKKHD